MHFVGLICNNDITMYGVKNVKNSTKCHNPEKPNKAHCHNPQDT